MPQVKEQVFSRVKKCHTGVEGEWPRSQATAYVSPLVSRALGGGGEQAFVFETGSHSSLGRLQPHDNPPASVL